MRSNYHFRPNSQIDTIIFDLDDTLVSWANAKMAWVDYIKPLFAQAYLHLTKLGYLLNVDDLAHAFDRNIREAMIRAHEQDHFVAVSLGGVIYRVLLEFNLPADDINIGELIDKVRGEPFPDVGLYPDTLAVLDELRERGYKIGLVTNSLSPMWVRDVELAGYGLLDRLDARITSGDTGFMKPHPAVFWRMLGLLNSTPDCAMFVGDSPMHDIRGANEVGLTSVQIDPPHLNREAKRPIEQPDFTITSLSELLSLLENLKSRHL